jgi:hypothetical protein
MKTLAKTLLAATLFTAFASCDNSEGGQSTPIDSTIQNGTAPAQYSEGTPETTIDTTIHKHDDMQRDTMNQGRARGTASGNGTNSSNTSDARTTTGSANNGDADGDRKK